MRHFLFFWSAFAAALCAQTPAQPAPPAAELKPDTVVAVAEGKKLTVADLQKLVEGLPPQMRANYARDPKEFLKQWFLLKRLVELAEKDKLDQQSPYKEGLAVARMTVLYQAQVEETSKHMTVSPEEQKSYYEAKKENYSLAKLKIIYIPFSNETGTTGLGGKKPLTEQQALSKAAGLVKEIRGGADFVKLVKEHSEDPVSAGKDGDFGPVRKSDNLPDPIKTAIFKLKPGEISDPVKQPNGFYIFRLIEFGAQPFEEVRDAIFIELKNQKLREWMENTQKAVDVKVENQAFFDSQKGR